MNEAGAGNTAEKPEPVRKDVAGSGEGTEQARQAFTAGKEEASEESASPTSMPCMNRRMPNGTYGGVRGGSP